MESNELPPAAQLMKFIVGKWISKPIYAAAELNIADILGRGPKSVDDLAKESCTCSFSLQNDESIGKRWHFFQKWMANNLNLLLQWQSV